MKVLLVHMKEYQLDFVSLSTRPLGIKPEPPFSASHKNNNCIVAFTTIEAGDTESQVDDLTKEIKNFCTDTKVMNVSVFPFGHLSNNLADSQLALNLLENITEKISKDFNTVREHFGSDKEAIFHFAGHPGAVRFRSF